MDYETLRHFADSYVLAALVALFVGIILYIFRPGARRIANEAARIPLKDD